LQNWYTQRHDARQEGIGRILTSGGDKRVFAMFVQGGGINKNFKLTTSATADPNVLLFISISLRAVESKMNGQDQLGYLG
jgi:hypothetical protein